MELLVGNKDGPFPFSSLLWIVTVQDKNPDRVIGIVYVARVII